MWIMDTMYGMDMGGMVWMQLWIWICRLVLSSESTSMQALGVRPRHVIGRGQGPLLLGWAAMSRRPAVPDSESRACTSKQRYYCVEAFEVSVFACVSPPPTPPPPCSGCERGPSHLSRYTYYLGDQAVTHVETRFTDSSLELVFRD